MNFVMYVNDVPSPMWKDFDFDSFMKYMHGKCTYHCGHYAEWLTEDGDKVVLMPATPAEKPHALTWPVKAEAEGMEVIATAKGVKWSEYGESRYAWVTGHVSGCADESIFLELVEKAAGVHFWSTGGYVQPGQWFAETPWIRINSHGRFVVRQFQAMDV